MLLFHSGKHGGGGAVQVGKPRIILFRTVYGFCSKPHDNTKHSRVLIHVRIPFVRAVAVSDAGGAGHEILFLIGSGNTLHQNGHLFVLFFQSAEPSVFQRGIVHGAGVHPAHRLFEIGKAFLRASLIDAEDGFIFPGKGVAETVFQETGRAHDKRALTEILDHIEELLPYPGGEFPVQKIFLQFFRRGKIFFFCALPDPQFPAAVGYDIGIEYVGTDVKRIVRFT